jgi:hypothetical protein
VPTSFGPCVHTPPERVNTHAAPPPTPLVSLGPPMRAVLPSVDSATEEPWAAGDAAPVPTSFALLRPHATRAREHPCCSHGRHRSRNPIVTEPANEGGIAVGGKRYGIALIGGAYAPAPTSFAPCCVHTPSERVNTHAALT